MARLNLLLLALLTACALGLVTSQHKARKLFVELEQEQERARSLEVEYGQLQLEASTWSMHARVERVAIQALRMRTPDAKRIQIVPREASPEAGAAP
jgi:cell division protein FtsL